MREGRTGAAWGRGGGHLPTVALIQESLWEVWKERKPADREGMMAGEGAARLQGRREAGPRLSWQVCCQQTSALLSSDFSTPLTCPTLTHRSIFCLFLFLSHLTL